MKSARQLISWIYHIELFLIYHAYVACCLMLFGPIQPLFGAKYLIVGTSSVVLVVKNLPASAGDERDVGLILGWEDSLEEGMATTPVLLPGESPWTEEPGGLQFMGHKESSMTEHRARQSV